MTAEELIKETKEAIQFNTKKVELFDKEIYEIKQDATTKIEKINKQRNQIVAQIIKDQGGLEKLEKLINIENQVKSK